MNLECAFDEWLKFSSSELLTRVCPGKRTSETWDLTFEGITTNIRAVMVCKPGQHEIIVTAHWNDECWDVLAAFEASLTKKDNLYFCKLCDENSRTYFKSRAELWRDHLFNPFEEWIRNKLAPAKWIVLKNYNGFTSASLSPYAQPLKVGNIAIKIKNAHSP